MTPTFTEDWFSDASQAALAELYDTVRHLDGDIVEVGCWEGRSTLALAAACAPEQVHAVDTWEGSPGEVSEELAAKRDVYATFRRNTAGHNITPHRCDWRDYFDHYRNPVKFCHIDATHTYEEVYDNILAVAPLLVAGAVLCGDDVHHPPIRRALNELFGEWEQAVTLWVVRC